MAEKAFPASEEYRLHRLKSYPDDASECRFLLGGIGTGNFSIGSRGQFCDWEIFGSPGKNISFPYTNFALRTTDDQGKPVARILESRLKPPYEKSHGYMPGELAGIPRFSSAVMHGEYPFVFLEFSDPELPLQVTLEAFTPFIPLNVRDSSIPGAVVRYRVRNTSEKARPVTVAGSLANAVGFAGYNLSGKMLLDGEAANEYRQDNGIQGIFGHNPVLGASHLKNGSMCLATRAENTTSMPEWQQGPWWNGAHHFWDTFMKTGRLDGEMPAAPAGKAGSCKIGSLGICKDIAPGGEELFEFYITWYFPNRAKAWEGHIFKEEINRHQLEKNYYTTFYSDAWDAAVRLASRLPELEQHSRNFHRALFTSTLPDYVIEALAANITTIRSTTCFRIGDGTFLSWEGTFASRGCCEGNCTHVWNYAQTLAFLFPELERSMRETEFLIETGDDGEMAFRTAQVFGDGKWDMLPAADGQLGTIIRLYRDWKLTGDDDMLRRLWPRAGKALDFAFSYWDEDGDYVLDSRQHNTYDIEFYGPNSMVNSIFYAALKAGAQIARYLGDDTRYARYQEALAAGSARMDALLWGGEYYIQALGDENSFPYQYGRGCLSDQVFGQLLAHICGLGHILPAEHVRQAVQAIYKYNFRDSLANHYNVQRTYALNDDRGLLLCSWPHGGRPKLPFVYCDEVWPGVEYQVAAHLIYEGCIEEGLTLVKAVRSRFDGYKRNPWNEVECGNHYVRSLASWAVLLALSGCECDLPHQRIAFSPAINQADFSSFFSTGKNWGIFKQKLDPQTGEYTRELETLYGDDISLQDY